MAGGAAPPPHNPPITVSGPVSGAWCGEVTVDGQVTIAQGETLTVCAGSRIIVQGGANATVRVAGTLTIEGTAEAPVAITGQGWAGLQVGGTMQGAHLSIDGAETGLAGLRDSQITLAYTEIRDCGAALSVANGATFDHLQAVGGSSVRITGGLLRLTDSVIDLQRPVNGADCLVFGRGGATIEHSRVTGCHCPLHINQADLPITVTNSILDGASFPVMIANAQAEFHMNHLSGTAADFDDIGGNIQANVTDNYYDGGPPDISSGNPAQFQGSGMYRQDPIPGVGPR